MSEGKRPGGLTALAVINFVLGGGGLLWKGLNILGMIVLLYADLGPGATEGQTKVKEIVEKVGLANLVIVFVLSVTVSFLLIISGIGYLMQKKFLGRFLGNTYVLVYIGVTIFDLSLVSGKLPGGGFSILVMVLLIYPVLTVILINTTFKDDLVN